MKNILKIGVLLLTLFLFVSCGKTPEEISTLLPDIALSGEVLTTIEVGSTYVDPGAIILGEFDLDYTTTSDLDTDTIGTYTITYSIDYLGITYSIDRTVVVVDSVLFSLDINISEITITSTSIIFTVSLDDPTGDLENPRVVLYQDANVFRTYDLTNGNNVITINTFSADTTYKVAVEGSYLSGDVLHYIEGYEVSFTSGEVAVTAQQPTIAFADVNATIDSISFAFSISDPDSVGSITNISLYEGETLLNTNLLLLSSRYISGLTGDTTYTLTATYTYNLNDGNGEQTLEATTTIATLVQPVPMLELNGEALMIIDKDSDFSNPGAVITNGFDLTIYPTSNVDTSIVGSYIMTYTIQHNSQTYGLLRYVLVVDLNLTEITTNSLTYTVDFMDEYDDMDNEKLSLYLDDTLVESVALINGNNTITFSDLEDDTDYTVVIEGSYTDSEETVMVESLIKSAKTSLDEPLMFTNTLEEIGVDYYSSTVNVVDTDEVLTSAVLTLYNDDYIASFVDLLVGDNMFYQSSLELETAYTLKIDYSYIPVGSSEPVSETQILSSFETAPIPKPKLDLVMVMVEYTYGFDYMYGIDETGFEDVGIYVVVRLNGDYVQTYQPSTPGLIEIDGLAEGTTYTIELYVDYTHQASGDDYYDLLLDSMTRTTQGTKSYALPTLDNLVITKTIGDPNSITLNFDLTDLDDAIFGDTHIRIMNKYDSQKDSEIIVVGTDIEVVFSGDYINPNEIYTIKVTSDYHIDSENSRWDRDFFEKEFVMIADVEVTSLEFEQSMYFHGDQIIMKLELDNGTFSNATSQFHDDVNVEYVTINGDKYYQEHFFFPSTPQTIYLNMGVETDYTDYSYHMTDFAVTLVDGSSYVIAYEKTLSFRLHQLGGEFIPDDASVSVVNITTDDQTSQISEDTSIKSYAVLNIQLDNIHNLDIYSVKVYGDTYLASDFNSSSTPKNISLSVELAHGKRGYSVSELVYIKDGVNVVAEQEYHRTSVIIYSYYAKDAISISTAQQLNSIDPNVSGKYYKLASDIDLDDLNGVPFNPINGDNVFDGGGYTISNLVINSTLVDQSSTDYIGLFGNVFALIYNVELSNVTITVDTDSTKTLYIGALIGKTNDYVINSHVTGTSSITVTGMTKGAVGGLIGSTNAMVQYASADSIIIIDGNNLSTSGNQMFVGGLVGATSDGSMNMSSASGSITITNTNNVVYNVGGLVGSMYSSNYSATDYVYSSYAQVDISTSNYGEGAAGGLVGKISKGYDTSTVILNSYASGDIYAKRKYIGGLVGDGGSYIENSFATGSVSTDTGSADKIRIASFPSYIFLINSYTYTGQTVNGETRSMIYYPGRLNEATEDVYNDQDFYLRVLGWNIALYDLNTLDIQNGMLPTIK